MRWIHRALVGSDRLGRQKKHERADRGMGRGRRTRPGPTAGGDRRSCAFHRGGAGYPPDRRLRSMAASRTACSRARNGARSSAERRATKPERQRWRPIRSGRGRMSSPGRRPGNSSDNQASQGPPAIANGPASRMRRTVVTRAGAGVQAGGQPDPRDRPRGRGGRKPAPLLDPVEERLSGGDGHHDQGHAAGKRRLDMLVPCHSISPSSA